MKQDLAIRALNMAVALRRPPPGCIHHTDRGAQYCAHDYQKLLRKNGFSVSMSGKGNCYDNSAVERRVFSRTMYGRLPRGKRLVMFDNWSGAAMYSASDLR